jgi:hypothetical protein
MDGKDVEMISNKGDEAMNDSRQKEETSPDLSAISRALLFLDR